MPQSILYYPTINIKDGPWLRSAALYWEEVCSIVPDTQFYDFSPEVSYMMERGQYRPIYPQDMLMSQYADAFSRDVLHRLEQRFFSTYPRKESWHQQKVIPDFSNPYLLHRAKIPDNIIQRLLQSGYVRRSAEHDWLEADSHAAAVYMRTLAEYIARYDNHNVVPGTDRQADFDLLYHRTGRHSGTSLFELSIVDILPVPANDIGFEAILDFKEHRQDELHELHQKIHELEKNIAHSESYEEIKAVLGNFKATWQRELHQAEHLFRGDGVGFALSGLRAFITDAGGAAGITQLAMPNHPVAMIGTVIGSGLIGVGIQFRNYRRKIKEEQQAQGFAYVIGARQNGLLRNCDLI